MNSNKIHRVLHSYTLCILNIDPVQSISITVSQMLEPHVQSVEFLLSAKNVDYVVP